MKMIMQRLILLLGVLLVLPAQAGYDPSIQRWIQRDPIGEEGGINLYNFVENDPINYFDPFGLQLDSMSSHPEASEFVFQQEIKDAALERARQAALRKALEERAKKKAGEIISKECKGSINKEFPEEMRNKSLKEIGELAKKGSAAARKARKLLNDGRFKK